MMPVANYAPEFIALYREGSRKPVTIDRLTRRRAVNLQFRLHSLRKEMRKELHEYLPAAERCVVRAPKLMPRFDPSLHDSEEDPVWQVTVEPSDADFAADLRRVGIEVSPEDLIIPERPEASTHQSDISTQDAVRRFLNQED